MPLVSVILPVFNAQKTLGVAIKSTLVALPKDSELLVVDDGSRDNSVAVARALEKTDKRLHVIVRDANEGIVSALNHGLESTDSEYVARMDADDVALPWRLRYGLEAVRRNTIDIAFTPVIAFGSKKFMKPGIPVSISQRAMTLNLLVVNPVAHSTMVAKRTSIVDAGGYRTVPSEDYDLWLRAAARGAQIVRLPVPSQLYRRHGSQITAQKNWQQEAATSPETAEAHLELSHTILGQRFDVFKQLRSNHRDGEELQLFFRAIEDAGVSLHAVERFELRRQIRKHRQRN